MSCVLDRFLIYSDSKASVRLNDEEDIRYVCEGYTVRCLTLQAND